MCMNDLVIIRTGSYIQFRGWLEEWGLGPCSSQSKYQLYHLLGVISLVFSFLIWKNGS